MNKTPLWACFIPAGPKWIAIQQGTSLEVYSLPDGAKAGHHRIPSAGRIPCAVGSDCLAMATEAGKIGLFSMPDAQQVATSEMPPRILQIRSDWLVWIASRGAQWRGPGAAFPIARAKLLAEREFELSSTGTTTPAIDISPDGSAVLYQTGLWSDRKMVWKWESDQMQSFELKATDVRLANADQVVGLWSGNKAGKIVSFTWFDLKQNVIQDSSSQTCLYNGSLSLEGAQASSGLAGLSVVCPDMVSAIAPSQNRLVPLIVAASGPISKLLAYDGTSQSICLADGRSVVVFAPGVPTTHEVSPLQFDMSFWSYCIAGNHALVVEESRLSIDSESDDSDHDTQLKVRGDAKVALQVNELVSLQANQYPLEKITSKKGLYLDPWGVCATPDLRRIAVLWQESSAAGHRGGGASGTVGSKFFRKVVRIYDVQSTAPGQTCPSPPSSSLKDSCWISGHQNRRLVVSPDGQTIAFCSIRRTADIPSTAVRSCSS